MGLNPRSEAQISLLADPVNRAVLTAVHDADQPLPVTELAERIVDDDVAVVRTAEYEAERDDAIISLHHARLPKLAAAGLIEYDRDANEAAVPASGGPDVDWSDGALDELLAQLRPGDGHDEADVRVLEGRESIVRYGRRLADVAEKELFCMYVTTDLLEDECIRRAQDAVDRGVDLSVGSRNAEVLDLARERLPEATVWEPQLDWLNASASPRLGRLVLADRRSVMLAVLEESERDGEPPEETAVVGDGEEHPLVVLVRELLGSRLDHLDYQNEAFRAELEKRQ